ncbi:hypothetical protein L2109_22390 [Citrobacter portucalensis]|nr:hypothetical protein [Citrobacter portucalensis]MDE9666229.1 hypothetical protein [Citrobacter portucalensis]MDE9676048.1 hypothetical protein [Citrobacter portucalensis]
MAEGFDFAIHVGELPTDSPQVARRLGDYHMAIAGAPVYLVQQGGLQRIGIPARTVACAPASGTNGPPGFRMCISALCPKLY